MSISSLSHLSISPARAARHLLVLDALSRMKKLITQVALWEFSGVWIATKSPSLGTVTGSHWGVTSGWPASPHSFALERTERTQRVFFFFFYQLEEQLAAATAHPELVN